MPVKSKRLTNKEKVLKAKTKKELQKQGLLLPDKPIGYFGRKIYRPGLH